MSVRFCLVGPRAVGLWLVTALLSSSFCLVASHGQIRGSLALRSIANCSIGSWGWAVLANTNAVMGQHKGQRYLHSKDNRRAIGFT